MTEPIELSFEVDCPAAHAFEVWTERISSWWPRSHTVSAEADATVMLERHVGGRIYERTMAGLARPQLRRLGHAAAALPQGARGALINAPRSESLGKVPVLSASV